MDNQSQSKVAYKDVLLSRKQIHSLRTIIKIDLMRLIMETLTTVAENGPDGGIVALAGAQVMQDLDNFERVDIPLLWQEVKLKNSPEDEKVPFSLMLEEISLFKYLLEKGSYRLVLEQGMFNQVPGLQGILDCQESLAEAFGATLPPETPVTTPVPETELVPAPSSKKFLN